MARYFGPLRNAEDWKGHVADGEKQWQEEHSAMALAYCWHEAGGFPAPIGAMLEQALGQTKMLAAFPEYQVPLPGGGWPSQNDLFVLARSPQGLVTIMVEGKVEERFDQTVAQWLKEASDGKRQRLAYLAGMLKMETERFHPVYYQLVHRTVSALIEAERFGAPDAVMLVHSFSRTNRWFDEFAAFAALFDIQPQVDRLAFAGRFGGVDLHIGWAHGDERYLSPPGRP